MEPKAADVGNYYRQELTRQHGSDARMDRTSQVQYDLEGSSNRICQ